jgi:hypothetical protein
LAAGIGLTGPAHASGRQICRPSLTFGQVQFSEMRPPTQERRWTAIVSVDASACMTGSGQFEIGFLRLKENGADWEFHERFRWSVPSVEIAVDFWADEAVEDYWIDDVLACPCAR